MFSFSTRFFQLLSYFSTLFSRSPFPQPFSLKGKVLFLDSLLSSTYLLYKLSFFSLLAKATSHSILVFHLTVLQNSSFTILEVPLSTNLLFKCLLLKYLTASLYFVSSYQFPLFKSPTPMPSRLQPSPNLLLIVNGAILPLLTIVFSHSVPIQTYKKESAWDLRLSWQVLLTQTSDFSCNI